jgi:hypothetical protein
MKRTLWLAALLTSAAPLSVLAATPTAITCTPVKVFNPNDAVPFQIVCPINVKTSTGGPYTGSITLSGPNASDFLKFGSGLLLSKVLPVGNYSATLTAVPVKTTVNVTVQPLGQFPTGVSCAPVAALTVATVQAGAAVCPIEVSTSDGKPFTGTVAIGTEQYTPYFAVSNSDLPANLVISPAGPPSAKTFTPQIVAQTPYGSFAAYITVPIAQ